MPNLAGMELVTSDMTCGGAFLTTKPFAIDCERKNADVHVEAKRGTRWLVVRLKRSVAASALLAETMAEAQLALDLFGRHGHFSALDTPFTDHLLWWDDGGIRLRAAHLTVFDAPKFNVRATHSRADGTVVPPPPTAAWQPVLRFYRLAHLTEDPIERFRYLYLGIENVISSISAKGPSEGEPAWLTRVLRTQAVDFAAVLSSPLPPNTDVVDHIVTTVYRQARLPAFHAKHGHQIFLPADVAALTVAAAACDIALRLLKELASVHGQRFSGSVLAPGGFELISREIAASARIMFSADTRRHIPSEKAFTHEDHPASELVPTATAERYACFLRAALDSPTLPIGRVGLGRPDRPLSATCYEAILNPQGAESIEFVLGLQVTQPGITWTAFPPP